MRVLILTTSLDGGGAEFVARTWAAWLNDHGHEVLVVMTSTDDASRLAEGIPTLSLKRHGHVESVRALTRELTDNPRDVVLSLQSYPNLIALVAVGRVAKDRRPALVISERNLTAREGEPTSMADRAKKLLATRLYRRAELTIAVSHAVAAELVSSYRVPGDRVVVVPNPAGFAAERRVDKPRTSDGSTLHIVLPMRMTAQKRPGLAVDVAVELGRRGIAVDLVCFGRGVELARLEAAAAAAGVPFDSRGWSIDWVADAPGNSVVLLPSYREGFGNVLVEAAGGGIPSVAVSSAFGVSDAVVPGVSGQLALTGEPEAVADAVLAAVGMPMPHVREWARRFSVAESGRLLLQSLRRAETARKKKR